jgi:hypothetical protein
MREKQEPRTDDSRSSLSITIWLRPSGTASLPNNTCLTVSAMWTISGRDSGC